MSKSRERLESDISDLVDVALERYVEHGDHAAVAALIIFLQGEARIAEATWTKMMKGEQTVKRKR